MSDPRDPIRSTRLLPLKPALGSIHETLELLEAELRRIKTPSEEGRPVLREQLQCSVKQHTTDDFVDEGYCSPSPTGSENEFFGESAKHLDESEVDEAQQTLQIPINGVLLQPPHICVTDENGETEIIAPEDDEHGQLWNFARDKIARRMFFVRADRRTRHMEATFYSDLYPVKNTSTGGSQERI